MLSVIRYLSAAFNYIVIGVGEKVLKDFGTISICLQAPSAVIFDYIWIVIIAYQKNTLFNKDVQARLKTDIHLFNKQILFFSFKETVYLLADTLLIFLFIEIHISGFYIIGYQCHANYHDSSFSSKRKDSFSMKYLFCVEIIEIFVAINLIILRVFFFLLMFQM